MIRFELLETLDPLGGIPQYVVRDYAFEYVAADQNEANRRRGGRGTTSLTMDTLQLEVAIETCLCLWVWGYCPTTSWKFKPLSPPESRLGGLRVLSDVDLQAGVSLAMDPETWTRWFDKTNGWFSCEREGSSSQSTSIEFATDTIAVLDGNELVALWVKPANWKMLT
jgi:hypothetical protein